MVNKNYVINLTLPQDLNTVLYVPDNSVVNINSKLYYQNGEYMNEKISGIKVVEKNT